MGAGVNLPGGGYGMGNSANFRFRYRIWFLTMAIGVGMMLPTVGTSHADSRLWDSLLSGASSESGHRNRMGMEERKFSVESARDAFERAKEAGAESASPYEYYMAKEYLELAQDELKGGDRIGVHRFSSKSEQFSSLAIEKSSGGDK
jgi:hypothetical protein